MLQKFGLTEGINDVELSAEPRFGDDCPKFWTCITGGYLDLRLELFDGQLVVSLLTLSVVLRLAEGFL